MTTETDLFELLDLSPGPPEPDELALKAQLETKKQEWARSLNQGGQKAKREAQKKLELLPLLLEIIADPSRRKAAGALAKARLEVAAGASRRELEETIVLLKKSSSYCDQAQLDSLVKRFEKIGRQEIERSLRAAGVSLERKPRKSAAKVEPIEAQLVKEIQVQVDYLGKRDLYDFLELPRQSSVRALRDQAKGIYRENQRLGRNDSRSSAANRLSGLCSDRVFVDEDGKKRYDAYLASAAMEALKPDLEFAGLDRHLSQAEVDHFLQSARRRGVGVEDALAFIERYAEERGWRVQGAEEHSAETLQQCGFCSALAPSEAKQCRSCGKSLSLDCPRCQRKNPATAAICFHCGCAVGDATVVEALLAEGKRLAVELQFGEALDRFERALLYWPDWAPLLAAKKDAQKGKRVQEERLAELESLVATRRLSAAEQLFHRLKRERVPGLDSLGERVRGGLQKSRQLFERGLAAREAGDRAGAEGLFDQALAFCADLPPLIHLLAENPPAPPTELRLQPLAQGFRLVWKAAEADLQYRVLRKPGGLPRDGRDGQILGEVATCELDDAEMPLGVACFYAVFSLRRGIPSRSAAGSGPFLRIGEVEEPKVSSREGEVRLSWRKPAGCRRIEVFRTDGGVPPADRQGEILAALDESCLDKGLARGAAVSYRIVAVFPAPGGEGEVRSAGWTCTALPAAPTPIPTRPGRETTIGYRLAICRSWLRRTITGVALELRSESSELVLPSLLVVAKTRTVPLSPQDGRLVLELPEVHFEKGKARIEIPPAEWRSASYIKIFFCDTAAGKGIRLLPAAKEELFLG